jgi:hypothetical protein
MLSAFLWVFSVGRPKRNMPPSCCFVISNNKGLLDSSKMACAGAFQGVSGRVSSVKLHK